MALFLEIWVVMFSLVMVFGFMNIDGLVSLLSTLLPDKWRV